MLLHIANLLLKFILTNISSTSCWSMLYWKGPKLSLIKYGLAAICKFGTPGCKFKTPDCKFGISGCKFGIPSYEFGIPDCKFEPPGYKVWVITNYIFGFDIKVCCESFRAIGLNLKPSCKENKEDA